MPERINVLVIEDNRLLREGLAAILDAEPGFKVVAAAEKANAGLRALEGSLPHVVLVDGALGSRSSHKLVANIRMASPDSKVVVMDLLPAQEDLIEFIQAGVSGFVLKDATLADFVRTIRAVAEGQHVLPTALTGTLLSHIAEQAVIRRLPGATKAVRMTKREREVVNLIAQGHSNKEIAQDLHLATDTVKSHVHNILEKLALHSRLQIAAYHHRSGGAANEQSHRPGA
ncbi:MAG: response regulator transcription factor [Gemmatimonadota bacterium]|nr:response regulator transcription factor [Gemmatimonadota bacterium]